MRLWPRRRLEWIERAEARVWVVGLVCYLVAGLGTQAALGQTGVDGAIGGSVESASGDPVAGTIVSACSVGTGLTVRAHSGTKGEFLLVRLPVGNYVVSAESKGTTMTLPDRVTVQLGEVTEIEVRMAAAAKDTAGVAENDSASSSTAEDLAGLPVNGGSWRSLALTETGTNDAAGADDGADEMSFRGVAVTENSSQTDGMSGDESFGGRRTGAGVEEEIDAGQDTVLDRAAGVGSGPASVVDGGRRAGSAYTFAQNALREFRVDGQGSAAVYGSAVYGHGVGGVVTAVSRAGGTRLHGMAFYTARDSVWAAMNPFSVASDYANGVVTSAIVKPKDVRQQFGARIGGPLRWSLARAKSEGGAARGSTEQDPKLFYLYAFDEQRRNFPAVSSPGYAGFYALTATQTALLANRGVNPAKTMAALGYLSSLTGTVARHADQTVNFGRVDWQLHGGSRVVAEYNRARWSQPAGARSEAVVDRGRASLGSSFGAVDMGVLRWVQFAGHGLSNELRLQDGRQLQYETPQMPLAQEPSVGPGGMPPEVAIGPDGLVFGTPAALGQRAYPDERRLEAADVLVWVKGSSLSRRAEISARCATLPTR